MKTEKFIKKSRAYLGMNQSDLAKALNTEHYNISKWERNITTPPGNQILSIVLLLLKKGISFKDFKNLIFGG
jgi:DNA-binding transcriptional regulator YiaG